MIDDMQAQQQPGNHYTSNAAEPQLPTTNDTARLPQHQPSRPYTTSVAELQVATSNDTLNRFLAGTRRAWMANAPSVHPTPRPKKPPQRPLQAHPTPKRDVPPINRESGAYKPQTGPRPSVLPSPAPSDEPSPAVSMTHDSPNPVPASLPEFRSMNNSSAPVAVPGPLQLPVTEARFAVQLSSEAPGHAAAAEGSQTGGQTQNGYTAQSFQEPLSSSNAGLSTHPNPQVLPILRPSSTGPSPAHGQVRAIQTQPTPWLEGQRTGDNTPDSRQQLAMPPAVAPPSGLSYPSVMLPDATSGPLPNPQSEHPPKRRRTENSTPSHLAEGEVNLPDAAGYINVYVAREGGLDAFTKDAEQPRLQLLLNACKARDYFFVGLHQLSCMWTRNPAEVYTIMDQEPKVTDNGFDVVQLVLKKNGLIHPRHLEWMAEFPAPLPNLIAAFNDQKQYAKYITAIYDVASFLRRASSSYSSLTQVFMRRGYPYLVDELIGQLDCRSATLQYVLFTASRRRLGVPDGPLGHSLDQAFFQDQRSHQDQFGTMRSMQAITDPTVLESRNSQLIQHYKHIVSQASRAREEHRRRSSQHAVPSSNPNSAAVTSSAQSPHQPLTSTPTQMSPNPTPVAQFHSPAPAHSFVPPPSQPEPQTVRQNIVLRSNAAPPQQTGPPPAHPSHINIARQAWISGGQMANQQVPGQTSPSLQGVQQIRPRQPGPWAVQQQHQQLQQPQQQLQQPQQQLQQPLQQLQQPQQQLQLQQQQQLQLQQQQQLLQQQQHQHQQQYQQQHQNQLQHNQLQQNQLQQNQLQQQQMIATHQEITNQALQQQQQMSQQQQYLRLQRQQQQQQQQYAQLAASHRMMELQNTQPVSVLVGQPQTSFPSPRPSSARTAIPTPGVSPVTPQFPSGARGRPPFVQQQPLQSPGLVQMEQNVPYPQQLQQQNTSGFNPFVPPLGQTIQLCDWPCDPLDKKAIMMSLHQASVRSPKRKVRPSAAGEPDERYYQAVKGLAVPPSRVAPMKRLYKYQFQVTDYQMGLKSQTTRQGPSIPLAEHFEGSLRWRVRTCKIAPNRKSLSGVHEWVGMDTAWPEHISISLNGEHIATRRRSHNGRDQPSELTPFVRTGTNELVIALAEPRRKTTEQYVVAVEIVETRSHSAILNSVWKHGVITEDETLKKIKSRMAATHDDDSVSVVVKDLSIDLADPFSRVMYKIPARGAHCTHMECFDLEIWLETRPSKTLKCAHSAFVPCTCNESEPSVADKWKCPICDQDARPYSLRIDTFLLNVRKQLEKENKLNTKSILVAADGTWQAVVEDDDDDSSDDDDEPRGMKPAPIPAPVAKKPVEVIELLDDD